MNHGTQAIITGATACSNATPLASYLSSKEKSLAILRQQLAQLRQACHNNAATCRTLSNNLLELPSQKSPSPSSTVSNNAITTNTPVNNTRNANNRSPLAQPPPTTQQLKYYLEQPNPSTHKDWCTSLQTIFTPQPYLKKSSPQSKTSTGKSTPSKG